MGQWGKIFYMEYVVFAKTIVFLDENLLHLEYVVFGKKNVFLDQKPILLGICCIR